MQCPQCGGENPNNAYFCGQCGYKLQSALDGSSGPVEQVKGGLNEPAAPGQPSEPPAPAEPVPAARASEFDAIDAGIPQQAGPSELPAPPPPAPPAPMATDTSAGLAPSVGTPPPPAAPPLQAAPQQAAPGYVPAPGYGYYMPPDGNTSGMGEGYPAPPQASGWTFAGFIPYGIYAFANGSALWGALGIAASLLGLHLIYAIVLGIMGRAIAWKNRRFDHVQQFDETMNIWSRWGLILLIVVGSLLALIIIVYVILVFGIIGMAMSESM